MYGWALIRHTDRLSDLYTDRCTIKLHVDFFLILSPNTVGIPYQHKLYILFSVCQFLDIVPPVFSFVPPAFSFVPPVFSLVAQTFFQHLFYLTLICLSHQMKYFFLNDYCNVCAAVRIIRVL